MNIKHPLSVLTLTLTPFFMTTGCSSTGSQSQLAATEQSDAYSEDIKTTYHSTLQSVELPTTPSTASTSTPEAESLGGYIEEVTEQPVDNITESLTEEEFVALTDSSTDSDIDDSILGSILGSIQDSIQDSTDIPSTNMNSTDMYATNLGMVSTLTESSAESTNSARPAKQVFRFGFDQAELTDDEKDIISNHGKFLASHPMQTLVIHGHADAQGDVNYNQWLSEKRAKHVAALLEEAGAQKDQIEVFSWSSTAPTDVTTNYKANRRVELSYDTDYFAQKGE